MVSIGRIGVRGLLRIGGFEFERIGIHPVNDRLTVDVIALVAFDRLGAIFVAVENSASEAGRDSVCVVQPFHILCGFKKRRFHRAHTIDPTSALVNGKFCNETQATDVQRN